MKSIRIVVFSVLFGSTLFFSSCGSKANEPAPRAAGRGGRAAAMTVSGVVLVPQTLDNIVNSSGTVLASESVDLAAEASGRVVSISFKEGAHVQKDELLVKLNDEDLQAQLKKTEAQIELAQEQAERQKRLFESNNTSKEQLEIAVSTVATLKADRENLIASIHKREIRAPFDGLIGLRYVSVGSYVSPTTRIATLQKVNPLKIDFAVPEKYAGKVRVGDLVKLHSDETNLDLMGRVYAVEPGIDPALRTLQLRALCENRGEQIFPGGYVHVELRMQQSKGALMVPTQAIVPVLKGQTVYVKQNGVVAVVPVKTGVRTASTVQVTSGLAGGDTVLTTGILQIRAGMPVNVNITN